MFKQGPTVTVYLNRRSGEFSVQPYARRFGVPQPFGIETVLSRDVRDEELLECILENLSKTDRQNYDFSQAPRLSSEERRRRLKEDWPIRVCHTQDGFELAPLKKMQNSFGSIEELTTVIPSNEFLSRGGKIIRQLFRDMY
jgi:hypothetical protein